MAIGQDDLAIMNPVRQQEMEAIRAANFLMNHDANGGEWIRFAKVLNRWKGLNFAEASAAASPRAAAAAGVAAAVDPRIRFSSKILFRHCPQACRAGGRHRPNAVKTCSVSLRSPPHGHDPSPIAR